MPNFLRLFLCGAVPGAVGIIAVRGAGLTDPFAIYMLGVAVGIVGMLLADVTRPRRLR